MIATLLNPRFKNFHWTSENNAQEIAIQKLRVLVDEYRNEDPSFLTLLREVREVERNTEGFMAELFGINIDEQQNPVVSEVDDYLALPREFNCDPLNW